MKTLLFTLLLTFTLSAQAGYRTIYVCDQNNKCQYITIYEPDQPRSNNYGSNSGSGGLMDNISNSGSKNFDTINRGWNPQQYR